MDNLANEEYVEAQKKGFMSDVKSFVHRCFGDKEAPGMCLDVYELTKCSYSLVSKARRVGILLKSDSI